MNPPGNARDPRRAGRDRIVLTALVLACLLPFLDKAFHVDDPLFLWAAAQIQAHPLDFFGHSVNWYGTALPMSEVTKNPPLTCYYIALVTALFGWSERALHAAFLVPALGAAWGSYALASRLTARPLLASTAAVLTPAFLVSSSSVMCDTMMLCFWVWSVVLWERGLSRNRGSLLLAGAMLVVAAALTKYYGVALIPLLAAYAWLRRGPRGAWALPLALCVAVLAGYEGLTALRYGRGLLGEAMLYPREFWSLASRDSGWLFHVQRALAGLTFAGACTASVLAFAPLWLGRRAAATAAIGGALLLAGFALAARGSPALLGSPSWTLTPTLAPQLALWTLVGIGVIALPIADHRRERSADSALLLLWVLGTLVFAAAVNWTVNGRSILPLVPAVGILIARASERRNPRPGTARLGLALGVATAAVLALAPAWADHRFAQAARRAAHIVDEQYGQHAGTVFIQGHWGFQYYAEALGAEHLDIDRTLLHRDDLVVMPLNNSWVFQLGDAWAERVGAIEVAVPGWISTQSPVAGAGFYTSGWGPLPFSLGRIPPEYFEIWAITRKVQLAPRDGG